MERTVFFIFLCTAVRGEMGEYIHVSEKKTWLDAQAYCRQNYTEFSFVSSQSDTERLLAASGYYQIGWIGLYRDPENHTAWKWSGGGYVTYQNWARGQPDDYKGIEDYVTTMGIEGWNDASGILQSTFICIHIPVEVVRKTWEEAMIYCRVSQKHLTSLHSDTESLVAMRAIQKDTISERVWIGLRYLGDRWLWVNGDPLDYKTWPQQRDRNHQYPIWNRCGALTRKGQWESWDCEDKLNFICS